MSPIVFPVNDTIPLTGAVRLGHKAGKVKKGQFKFKTRMQKDIMEQKKIQIDSFPIKLKILNIWLTIYKNIYTCLVCYSNASL